MKKLLLVAAILAISATVFGAPITRGTSSRPLDEVMYPVGPSAIDPVVTANGGHDGGNAAKPYHINDNKVHYENGVNIFRLRGEGWEDEAKTRIQLKVIEGVTIEAESANIYAEAVKGDKVSFGDLGFRVTGGADTKVTFEFKGVLFESGLEGGSTLFEIGGAKLAQQPNFNEITDIIVANEKFIKDYEIDLYFDLASEDLEADLYQGDIIATAMYQ